jgi:LAS superfamily LD-carboxypeptidase LdcB
MHTTFLRSISLAQKLLAALFIVLVAVIVFLSWYGYERVTTLSAQIAELASTTEHLQNNIAEATTSLGDAISQEKKNVQSQIGGFKDQVGSITGTVTDLQKLSKTDPELLAKYSKVFFLSENYAPVRLVDIPTTYSYSDKNQFQIIPEVLPHLTAMLNQAKTDGIPLFIQSAYRSFDSQQSLKSAYKVTYGAGTANSFSADQGYSEHQLGTTVDLITTGTNGLLTGFEKTPSYTWVAANAYRYGFALSYPKANGYYMFEPWHWRFVGVKLATELHNSNTYFYEMDQRTIDTYLLNLFD